MNNLTPEQHEFVTRYLTSLPEAEQAVQIFAEHFCADEYNANECARLINIGQKTATCSLKAAYEIEHEPLPAVGRLTLVLNWSQQPVCIIRTSKVTICPFNQVEPEFAAAEGEGDGSYEWWRDAHMKFFSQYAEEVGTEFNEDSELVLEHFDKVYP
ncbi:RNA-binding protein [Bacterioplanes sanyensis]|uniref:ASCH domain-containing protein n=1 Tax=Bacterioplanes sanyensis TaxID=1249553 RepID=UPI00167ADB6B|nr:ASCH domain-containing protein [Bacterioplanes sanyensis]GGY47891.1 RNA-binding protein [Bacterioplanes sanyensis]